MSRKKLDDALRPVPPYATFGRGARGQHLLIFNPAAARMCEFKHLERVDLYFDRRNKIWDRSVIIMKKGGSQRSLNLISRGQKNSWWRVYVTRLIKQFDISLLSHRLPILDYADGEVFIDASRKDDQELDQDRLWKGRTGRRVRTTLTIKGKKEIVINTNEELLEVVNALAKRERKTRTKFILDAVRFYIEDKYEW